MGYGIAICKEDVALLEWGGDVPIKIWPGDLFEITYHEYTGCLGLSKDGVQFHCPHNKRKHFDEKWEFRENEERTKNYLSM